MQAADTANGTRCPGDVASGPVPATGNPQLPLAFAAGARTRCAYAKCMVDA